MISPFFLRIKYAIKQKLIDFSFNYNTKQTIAKEIY